MRLLLIGTMDGQIGAASQIAIKKGGSVIHAVDVGEALDLLRSGKGADLIMIDVRLDIYSLVESLNSERISIPVVACGVAACVGSPPTPKPPSKPLKPVQKNISLCLPMPN